MSNQRMTRLSQIPDSGKTFSEIRRVLHPETVITRCCGCNKAFRFEIRRDRSYICLDCMEKLQ